VAAIKTILTLLPHAAPILKSAGWHASKQYYRNGTLKVSRQTVTPEILRQLLFLSQLSKSSRASKYTGCIPWWLGINKYNNIIAKANRLFTEK